eukprot:2045458-Rhodomonas_salina.3
MSKVGTGKGGSETEDQTGGVVAYFVWHQNRTIVRRQALFTATGNNCFIHITTACNAGATLLKSIWKGREKQRGTVSRRRRHSIRT